MIDLLSVSWGLGFKHATDICDTTIPRWRSGSGLDQKQIEVMLASFASFTDEGPFQAIRKKMMEVLATPPMVKNGVIYLGSFLRTDS
jgi:hypothetical protein